MGTRTRSGAGMGGLIGLNAALLGALAFVTFAPGAAAQQRGGAAAPAAAARNPGDYTMVAGQVQGQSEDTIYIVDGVNREILAVRWDQSRRTITGVGFRDLNVDGQAAGRGGR